MLLSLLTCCAFRRYGQALAISARIVSTWVKPKLKRRDLHPISRLTAVALSPPLHFLAKASPLLLVAIGEANHLWSENPPVCACIRGWRGLLLIVTMPEQMPITAYIILA